MAFATTVVLIFAAILVITAATVAFSSAAQPTTSTMTAHLGAAMRYNSGPDHFILGDTWNTAWTDDKNGHDTLYSIVDDTKGPQDTFSSPGCERDHSCGRNLALSTFGDTVPPNLQIRVVNDMLPFGFGNQSPPGHDGETWKANGLTALSGTLYMSVSRHSYGQYFQDYRQRARDASILRSADHGKTWAPTAPGQALPIQRPMFPGNKFATPIFIQYGKDGAVPEGVPAEDKADKYLYAVSNNGFWDNGDRLYLGRVPRDKVMDARVAVPYRKSDLGHSRPCSPYPFQSASVSQAGIQYLAPFHLYVLLEWYYPNLNQSCTAGVSQRPPPKQSSWDDPYKTCVKNSRWEFYQSAHPWGPWVPFFNQEFGTDRKSVEGGYYNPWIPNKFIPDHTNPDGSLTTWVMATGNFMTYGSSWNETQYTLHLFPFTLRAH